MHESIARTLCTTLSRLRACYPRAIISQKRRTFSSEASTVTDKTADKAPQERKRDGALAIEEALYLAKEAGFFTTAERQLQIIRSPAFSPDRRPFALENFYDTLEAKPHDRDELAPRDLASASEEGSNTMTPMADMTDMSAVSHAPIHDAIVKAFNPQWTKVFMHFADGKPGREYLTEAEGRGTCKRAAAHVKIVRGTGVVKINGELPIYHRWPLYFHRMDVLQPFYLTGTAGVFDCFISVKGSGTSGQSVAVRLAVGRALVNACPSTATDMEEDMVLYEDLRKRMPKMPGRKHGARGMKKWKKR